MAAGRIITKMKAAGGLAEGGGQACHRDGVWSHREPRSNLRSASLFAESPGHALPDLTVLLDGVGGREYKETGTQEAFSTSASCVPTGPEMPDSRRGFTPAEAHTSHAPCHKLVSFLGIPSEIGVVQIAL